jgi:hypothetical protein
VLHSPAMEEWLWWLKFYAAVCVVGSSFFGGMYWLFSAVIKKMDGRTEGIVRTVLVGVVEAFQYEFQKRDSRADTQDERIVSIEARLVRMAIAGTSLASVSLYPTSPPSKRERDRIIDDWRKLIDESELDYKGEK